MNFGKNYLGENCNSNFLQGNKIFSEKKQNFMIFSLGNIHCKNFQTLYESCKDPQICIFKNYKRAAGIWRKILMIISFFKKLVKWQHLNTGSIGFALISECKSNAHTLSFNRFIKKCQILVLCNKQFINFFIMSR